jgi:hypothetical protein
VNIKAFFVSTLSSALELGIATPDDVLRHVTADVLSIHLPRQLWARLLTAALGASRLDAQLVVETVGVPNLCEHIPSPIIWACIAELGQRVLSGVPAQPISRQAAMTPPAMKSQPVPLAAPPPEVKREAPAPARPAPAAASPTTAKPSDGLADVVAALESDERQTTPSGRARSPTGPRFRQASTGIGRLAAINTRRPQAPVPAAEDGAQAAGAAPGAAKPSRRGQGDVDGAYEIASEVKEDWKSSLAVEDEQLVDWQGSEETQTAGEEYRKR